MAEIHGAAFQGREPWDEAAMRALLDRPATRPVARNGAFALLQILPPEAELLTIAVHPDAQGRSLGRDLLAEALEVARSAGCAVVHLEVAADNAPALALYVGAGFRETGRRRGYYARTSGQWIDALVMSVSLSAQHKGSGA